MSLSLRSIRKRAIMPFLVCSILLTANVLAQPPGGGYTGQLTTTIKPIPAEGPGCSDTQFYDVTAFVCRDCPTDAAGYISPEDKGVGATTALSCRCKSGYYLPLPNLALGIGATPPQCKACEAGTAPNQQGSGCGTCDSSKMEAGKLPITATKGLTIGQCACKGDTEVFKQTYTKGIDGAAPTYKISCEACPAGQFAGPGWACKKCADFKEEYKKVTSGETGSAWTCQCREGYRRAGVAGSACVSNTDYNEVTASLPGQQLISARSLTFRDVVSSDGSAKLSTSDPVESDLFGRYLVESAVGCTFYQQPQMCQLLANLCVLTMYDAGSGACSLFDGLVADLPSKASTQYPDDGWRNGLPWLTYEQDVKALLQTSLKSQNFDLTVGFYDDEAAGRSQYLTFVLAKYALDGKFLGFQQLASQMSACPMTYNDVLNMQRFGAMTENNCEFDLFSLMQGPDAQPESANVLFELFLKDDKGNLIDVPVLIKNLRLSGAAEGAAQTPNTAAPTAGEIGNEGWHLRRRFFVFDSVSGIDEPGGYVAKQKPRYIRWANDVKIKVTMDPTTPEAVYRPYAILDYRAGDGKSIDLSSRSSASFVMEYYSDYGPIMTRCLVAFICLFVLVIILWAGRMRNWNNRNPKDVLGPANYASAFTFKAAFYFFDTWSQIMFWLLFFSCATVFIAFKLQVNAALLLPELGEASAWVYSAFYGVLGATLACRALAVMMRIYEQGTIDIFFIDSERPNFDTKQVNAWRHVFITNEFAELESGWRPVSPETTFIWFCFFWVGLGWQNLSQSDPSFSVADNPVQASNPILKFFVVALLFLTIGGLQAVYHKLEAIVSGSTINQFVDLCTLANISIVILEEHLYGYYLHAKAPWGSSDIPLDWLQTELQREASQSGQGFISRGLKNSKKTGKDDSVQTSQIYIPHRLKKKLAHVRTSKLPMAAPGQSRSRSGNHGRRKKRVEEEAEEGAPLNGGSGKKAEPSAGPGNQLSGREHAIKEDEYHKRELNRVLKQELAENLSADQIKETTWWARLVGTLPTQSDRNPEPLALASLDSVVVIEDPVEQYPSFQNVLYCSLDLSLVLLYIMFFFFFDMLFNENGLLSVFAVYVVERLLRYVRAELGERNLCQKAHVDDRFLV